MNDLSKTEFSRRHFLKNSSKAMAGTALLSGLAVERFAHGALSPSDTVRVALVGCGGRGSGAANQALSTSGPVKLIAVADAHKDNLDRSLKEITTRHKEKVDVPEEHRFIGFDAYKQAIQIGRA